MSSSPAHISLPISRRAFVRGVAGAVGLSALGAAQFASGGRRSSATFYIDRFRQAGDIDSTPSIRRAIEAAQDAGGGRVVAAAGRVYGLVPHTSYVSRNPSGGTARYPVCLQIPSGVTLDMRGSTLRLLGTTEAVLVANANLAGAGLRDAHIGLSNVVLDGRNVPFHGASLLHLAYADNLVLRSIKLIRGSLSGGWIYNCRASVFDELEVDGFHGQPWTIGDSVGTGNQVYDSSFGRLRARNVTKIDNETLRGNSFVLTLTRCRVRSIDAHRCAAGIKLQRPSRDVVVGSVTTSDCGDAEGNSGLKIQGDLHGRRVTRVRVGEVIARNQTGTGLLMDGSVDCTVDSYRGLANNTNGNWADVWIGGHNDHVKQVRSDKSGGDGVVIRAYATGYRLDHVWVRNPGQDPRADGDAGVAIFGGSGTLGGVKCVDTDHPSTMGRGVDVVSPDAVGHIAKLEVTGQGGLPFKSVSTMFPAPRGW